MLSSDALKIISRRFPAECQQEIIIVIEAYLKSLIKLYKTDATPDFLERITCAILKCSGSRLEKFKDTMTLAGLDWRDLLVVAGFANSTTIHLEWLKKAVKKVENIQLYKK